MDRINESPNTVTLNKELLKYFDIDALPFYIDDDNKIYICNPGTTHGSISLRIENGKVTTHRSEGIMHAGRVWLNHRVFSFYHIPDNLSEILSLLQQQIKGLLEHFSGIKEYIDTLPEHTKFKNILYDWNLNSEESLKLYNEFNTIVAEQNKYQITNFSITFYALYDKLKEFSKENLSNYLIEVCKDMGCDYIRIGEYLNSNEKYDDIERVQHVLSPLQKKNKAFAAKVTNTFRKEANKLGISLFGDSANSIIRYITESPDEVEIVGEELTFDDLDSIPFGYINGKLYISEPMGIHSNAFFYIENNKFETNTEDFIRRDGYQFSGRLWLYYNLISFWKFPKQQSVDIIQKLKNTLKTIYNHIIKIQGSDIEDVKKYVNSNIETNDFEYAVELLYNYLKIKENLKDYINRFYNESPLIDTWNIRDYGGLVKLDDLLDAETKEVDTSIQHVKSPLQKTGVKKSLTTKNTFRKEANKLGISLFGDSANSIIRYITESPDEININGQSIMFREGIPFGYKNDELYLGLMGSTHGTNTTFKIENDNVIFIRDHINTRHDLDVSGRVWLNVGVISFWQNARNDFIKQTSNKIISYLKWMSDKIKPLYDKLNDEFTIDKDVILRSISAKTIIGNYIKRNFKTNNWEFLDYVIRNYIYNFQQIYEFVQNPNFVVDVWGDDSGFLTFDEIIGNASAGEEIEHIKSPLQKTDVKKSMTTKNTFRKEANKLGISLFGDSAGYNKKNIRL